MAGETFDVVVLGGGPGGYAAALYGAAAGLDVALVEEGRVGGTCLHRGCIPAKELLQTAEVFRTVAHAGEFGVEVGAPAISLPTSQKRKRAIVDRLTKGLEGLLKGRKVTVHAGTGRLGPDGRSVTVEGDAGAVALEARRGVVLATGSQPRSLPGLDFDGHRLLSSDDVLELDEVPSRAVVIGGGAIGCEFASFLRDVGSEVTLLEALPRLLAGVDEDASVVVARAFAKRGITVKTGVEVAGAAPGASSVTVSYRDSEGEHAIDADVAVVSVGRSPRSAGIGLAEAGVELDERGFVAVDELMRTSVAGVYAVGDLVATPQLAHVGFAEAIVAITTILGEDAVAIDYAKVPWGIYCHPEVAFCGLTEAQAREAGHDVVVSTHRFAGNGRALIIGEPDGIMKIVAAREGPVLGVHIVGPWATELLGEGYLAVNWEALPGDVASLVHPHPTLGELFGESAMALTGRALHG